MIAVAQSKFTLHMIALLSSILDSTLRCASSHIQADEIDLCSGWYPALIFLAVTRGFPNPMPVSITVWPTYLFALNLSTIGLRGSQKHDTVIRRESTSADLLQTFRVVRQCQKKSCVDTDIALTASMWCSLLQTTAEMRKADFNTFLRCTIANMNSLQLSRSTSPRATSGLPVTHAQLEFYTAAHSLPPKDVQVVSDLVAHILQMDYTICVDTPSNSVLCHRALGGWHPYSYRW